jgi:hypothetical protein
MGCCGQKRGFFKGNPSPVTMPQGAEPTGQQPVNANYGQPGRTTPSVVSLIYLESSPITVQGPATGIHYQFSSTRPVQAVDPRDVVALLRTRFFRRV